MHTPKLIKFSEFFSVRIKSAPFEATTDFIQPF